MKRFVMALGIASVSLGLALPFVFAQERGAGLEKGIEKGGEKACLEKMGCECVTIDKPYSEIVSRVPEAISKSGLIEAGVIDWGALRGRGAHGSMPGETPRVDEKMGRASNVKTFLFADEKLIERVFEKPMHGFWSGKLVLADLGGKTELFYMKPSMKLEELKKHGVISEDKYSEHMKEAQSFERKIDQVVNAIKTER